jgi:splicing factor 3B subunit 3
MPAHPSHPPPAPHLQDPTGEAAAVAQKHLTFYELDLGLNHVVRKSSEPVDNGANLLIPVPGGDDGPGGVLVCAENFIFYRNQVCAMGWWWWCVGGC